MAINLFNFLKEDVRLLQFENCLYKIKILYEDQDKLRQVVPQFSQKDAHEDIEKVIRAVLYILKKQGDFHKIQTERFIVTIKSKPWKAAHKIGFKLNGGDIMAHSHMIILNLKLKSLSWLLGASGYASNNISDNTQKSNYLNELKNDALNSKACVMLKKVKLSQEANCKSDSNSNRNGNRECAELPSTSESDRNSNKNRNNEPLPSTSGAYSRNEHILPTNVNVESPIDIILDEENQRQVQEEMDLPNYVQTSKVPQLDAKQKHDTNEHKVVKHGRRNIPTEQVQTRSHSAFSKTEIVADLTKVPIQQDRHSYQLRKGLLRSKSSVLSLRSRSLRQKNLLQCSRKVTGQNNNINTKKRTQDLVKADNKHESQRLNCQLQQHVTNTKHCSSPRNHQKITLKSSGVNVSKLKLTRKDRHFIEQEELAEDMKLQQLAKTSPKTKSKNKSKERRSSSGIWSFMEDFISPVKNIFSNN